VRAAPLKLRHRATAPVLVAIAALLGTACASEASIDRTALGSSSTLPPAAPGPGTNPEPPPPDEPVVVAVDQELDWRSCTDVPEPEPGITGGVECTTLRARLDHADPESRVIDLAVARRPATSGRAEGVIVVNPGGPGASGVDAVAHSGGVVPDELRERFDVVGMDTRGTERSLPIRCVDDGEFLRYLDDVDPTPDDGEDIRRYQALVEDFERACVRAHGELLPYLGTRFVARDVEALRVALGTEVITWFGYSYGTLVGTVYAEEFPHRVHALVLDGPVVTEVPPDEAADIDLGGLQRTVGRFARACDTRSDCPLAAHGGTLAALDAVIDRVIAGDLSGGYELDDFVAPAGRPGEWPVGEGRIGYALVAAVYDESSWTLLEDGLAAVLEDDWGGWLRLLGDIYLARFEQPPEGTAREQTFWALRCADRAEELEVATIEEGIELERRVLGDPYRGRPSWLADWRLPNVWCLHGIWPEPAERLGAAVVAPDRAPPALVFGATGDFATPIEYLEPLADAVGGGHVVRVRSNDHVNMGSNRCERRLATSFVEDPSARPVRSTC
jgi:pimeloyl-ACP methyl ester carboxylesterase